MSGRIAVLASGGGTNLQALLDHFHAPAPGDRVAEVVLVISDREGAGALERARSAGVAARVVPVAGRAEADVAAETLRAFRDAGVEVVALAGYLRRVPGDVVREYRGRILNVHPALLPAFGGKGMYGRNVHRAVLDAGCRVTGATVHHVDEEYDTGPILVQWPVPVLPGDTAETLAARVLMVEHVLYPLAVESVVRGRVAAAGAARGPAPSETGPAAGAAAVSDGGGGPTPPPLGFHLMDRVPPEPAEVRRLLGPT